MRGRERGRALGTFWRKILSFQETKVDACDESEAVGRSQALRSVLWSGERASEEGLQGSSRSSYCSWCSPPSSRPGTWSAEDVQGSSDHTFCFLSGEICFLLDSLGSQQETDGAFKSGNLRRVDEGSIHNRMGGQGVGALLHPQ